LFTISGGTLVSSRQVTHPPRNQQPVECIPIHGGAPVLGTYSFRGLYDSNFTSSVTVARYRLLRVPSWLLRRAVILKGIEHLVLVLLLFLNSFN
jgi:hypothetical protein